MSPAAAAAAILLLPLLVYFCPCHQRHRYFFHHHRRSSSRRRRLHRNVVWKLMDQGAAAPSFIVVLAKPTGDIRRRWCRRERRSGDRGESWRRGGASGRGNAPNNFWGSSGESGRGGGTPRPRCLRRRDCRAYAWSRREGRGRCLRRTHHVSRPSGGSSRTSARL